MKRLQAFAQFVWSVVVALDMLNHLDHLREENIV
jgi:hypothetical protein